MKFKIDHPLIVDAVPLKLRTTHKVPLGLTTVFDVPYLSEADGAIEAITFEKGTNAGGHRATTHRIMQAVDGFYETLHNSEGRTITGTDSRSITACLTEALEGHALAEAQEIHKNHIKNMIPILRPTLRLRESPGIMEFEGKIDTESLGSAMERARTLAGEFAVINNALCRRCPEPIYVVRMVKAGDGTTLNLVMDGTLPQDMVACFRPGRLDDARAFCETLRERFPDGRRDEFPRRLVEHAGTHSEFDDIGVTIANAAWRAWTSFSRHEQSQGGLKRQINELLLDIPLEHIGTARKLNEATANRTIHHLAEDAEALAELVAEAASYGERTNFCGSWMTGRVPLAEISALWENRSIGLEFAQERVAIPK